MKYLYKARDKNGEVKTGTIEAVSKEAAASLLQKYNIFATHIEEQEIGNSLLKMKFERKISRRDLSIFFRQLSTMLGSQVPVVQSLLSLATQTRKNSFKKVITEVSNSVQDGISLSDAFAMHPKVFSNFYVNLVKSGEASGNVADTLEYISEHAERENDIVSQLRQAMVYPAFVLCVLFVVMGIVIVEIIPKIAELIKETNKEPSSFTKITLGFYEFLGSYWWAIAISIFLLVILAVYYFNTQEGRKNYYKISLSTPFLGEFFKKIFLSRFCGNISTLLSAGISINKALKIAGDAVNNITYKSIIYSIEKEVSEGEKMSSVMVKYSDYFPLFVIQMIKVGEETGKLDQTLKEIVIFYQKEIKRAIDLFASLLEPIMIIFLGAVVAIMALSVLSPLYGTLGNI